jgi:hypothetical protein
MAKKDNKLPSTFKPSGDYDKRTFQAGMNAELQKFGEKLNPKRLSEIKQLVLGEAASPIEEGVEEFKPQDIGLNFNKSQDKAFSGLQKLLDETDYEGNVDPKIIYGEDSYPVYSNIYNGYYELPALLISWTDYYRAYGLKKNKSGKYSGRQVKQAKQALRDLADGWTIFYKRKKKNNKYDLIKSTRPLIKTDEGYKNIKDIENIGNKKGKLLIKFSPLFIDRLDTFFLYKPMYLHNEIKEVAGSRYSKYYARLIQYLNKTNFSPIKIDMKKLAHNLRMYSDINARMWKRIRNRIDKGLEIAKELEFILDFEKNYDGFPDSYWIELNPERCSRYRLKLKKGNNSK